MAIYTLGSQWSTVDLTDNAGNTPLHIAVEHKRASSVRYLLSLGGNVEASNDEGLTPLHMAVKSGNLRSAKDLLLRGASRNA